MAEPLKNIFSQEFYTYFINHFSSIFPLTPTVFLSKIFDTDWENKALKQRISHTARVLHECMPISYTEQISCFRSYITQNKNIQNSNWMLGYLFIPQFIEDFGLDYYKISIEAIELVTQFTSCEFAIRPFIQKYPQETMEQMLLWSKHSHANVRRLASEGCRPRLPWGQQLTNFIKDPSLILPILENLKTDESLFVRKSVANNLNDISKDNTELVLKLCTQWKGTHEHTDWIIKHGLRTLLKQGNKQALAMFESSHNKAILPQNFQLLQQKVDDFIPLNFTFSIHNNQENCQNIRVEYILYFLRDNGTYSKKVFKIHERKYAGNEIMKIKKLHYFKKISTRKYYNGIQFVSLQINGEEYFRTAFDYSSIKENS